MDMMREFPDKHFDLAIVDPPYGIFTKDATGFKNNLNQKLKDDTVPCAEYFSELKRVSRNQIIWGGNYFGDFLGAHRSPIVWDKQTGDNYFADGEMAWTSFATGTLRLFRFQWCGTFQGDMKDKETRIHPTQKPVALYRWLLTHYAKPGDTILDTHLGSGSSAIACHYAGHHLTACELDADYYKAACERIDRETRQQTLFTETSQPTETQTELI